MLSTRSLHVVTYLLLIAFYAAHIDAIFSVKKRFQTDKLIDAGSVGLEDVDGTIAAFGDFNGDKYTDVFVLNRDQNTLQVYLWNHLKFRFENAPDAELSVNDFKITNVVPADFDQDGKLDVMVMGQVDPKTRPDSSLYMRVFLANWNNTFSSTFLDVPASIGSQPLFLDFNGDMKVDMLGKLDGSSADVFTLWKNIYDDNTDGKLFNTIDAPLDTSFTMKCDLASPNSHALVDFDGDCLPDLFITCQTPFENLNTFQIWLNKKDEGFQYSRGWSLPKGLGQISFADMDRDGAMDMVFSVCDDGQCSIHIAYNKQKQLCTIEESSLCRKSSDLCTADPDYNFDIRSLTGNDAYVVIPLDVILKGEEFVTKDDEFQGILPIPLRIGDYNNDGYPDLLVVTKSGLETHVSLLESVPCETPTCSENAVKLQRRMFKKVIKGAEALNDIKDARNAAFFDMDEDGTLDIIVTRGTSNSRKFTFIQNNYYHDAFFLKSLFLNGACEQWCYRPDEPRYQPFGASTPGATFKFTVLDPSGNRRVSTINQQSQLGYHSLQTPYSFLGLGRTNNYVEELFVGSTRHQKEHYTTIVGVIPNSQLIILPYQPDDVKDTSTWSKELYLHPGDWVPWVLVTLIVVTVILGCIVLFLTILERREDELERKRARHLLNFDAL